MKDARIMKMPVGYVINVGKGVDFQSSCSSKAKPVLVNIYNGENPAAMPMRTLLQIRSSCMMSSTCWRVEGFIVAMDRLNPEKWLTLESYIQFLCWRLETGWVGEIVSSSRYERPNDLSIYTFAETGMMFQLPYRFVPIIRAYSPLELDQLLSEKIAEGSQNVLPATELRGLQMAMEQDIRARFSNDEAESEEKSETEPEANSEGAGAVFEYEAPETGAALVDDLPVTEEYPGSETAKADAEKASEAEEAAGDDGSNDSEETSKAEETAEDGSETEAEKKTAVQADARGGYPKNGARKGKPKGGADGASGKLSFSKGKSKGKRYKVRRDFQSDPNQAVPVTEELDSAAAMAAMMTRVPEMETGEAEQEAQNLATGLGSGVNYDLFPENPKANDEVVVVGDDSTADDYGIRAETVAGSSAGGYRTGLLDKDEPETAVNAEPEVTEPQTSSEMPETAGTSVPEFLINRSLAAAARDDRPVETPSIHTMAAMAIPVGEDKDRTMLNGLALEIVVDALRQFPSDQQRILLGLSDMPQEAAVQIARASNDAIGALELTYDMTDAQKEVLLNVVEAKNSGVEAEEQFDDAEELPTNGTDEQDMTREEPREYHCGLLD